MTRCVIDFKESLSRHLVAVKLDDYWVGCVKILETQFLSTQYSS